MEAVEHSGQNQQIVTSRLREIQQKLIDLLLRVYFAVGTPVIVYAINRALSVDSIWPQIPFNLALWIVLLVLTFWKRIPYEAKVGGFVLTLYATSIFEFFEEGLSGSGQIFLFAATVFPVLFYRRREALLANGISTATMIGFGWAFSSGGMDVPIEAYATSLNGVSWVKGTTITIGLAAVLIISQNLLLPELSRMIFIGEQSEQARRQSDQRFRMVVESSRNGIFIIGDEYKFNYANDQCVKFLGYSESELIGLDFRQVLDEESKQLAADLYIRRQQGEPLPSSYEISIVRKDGQRRQLAMNVAVVMDADGNPQTIGQVKDITEQRQFEQSVQQANLVIESSPVVVFRWNAAEGWPVEYVSDNVRQFGYTPDDFYTGTVPYTSIVHPEDLERFHREVLIHLERGDEQFEQQYRIITQNGDVRWTDDRTVVQRDDEGNVTHYQGVVIDITQQKQVAEDLARSDAQFRALIESAHIGIMVFDHEYRFEFVNEALCRILGRSHDKLIGSDFRKVLDEVSLQVVTDRYLRHQRRERPSPRYQFNILRPSGAKRRVEISTAITSDAEGNPRTMAHMTDITESDLLKRQVQEAYKRRGYHVKVSTEIAQEISQATVLSELFEKVVTQIKKQLGYYHTQLLRYEPAQDAVVLICGYGNPGRQMVANGHQMPLGIGLIGIAAETGKTMMRPDLTEDPDWHPNSLLPRTRGEIAVPIKLGAQILGVLDVQSDVVNALTEDDRLLLEGICGQVAIAMDQTRMRQEMDERIREVSTFYQAMSQEGWQRFQNASDFPEGFFFDQSSLHHISEVEINKDQYSEVPMSLPDGAVIGTLAIDESPDKPLTVEDREFLEQVSEQVALALDGARLTQQTQEALGETEVLLTTSRMINEALTIEEMLAGVAEMAPLMGIESVSLHRVSSWDEIHLPRTFDLFEVTIAERKKEFVITYEDDLIPDVQEILSIMDAPGQMRIFSDADDENSIMPLTVRENLTNRGLRGSMMIGLLSGERVLGFLSLNSGQPMNMVPERSIRIMQDVLVDQVSTFLENMRVIEQTQRKVDSETLVNIIGQRIQSTTSVEDALQVAIKELGTALGVKKTAVQLELPRKDGQKSSKSE